MKIKSLCGMCPDKCSIIATVEDDRLIRVEPDPDLPRGRVCPRGALSPQIVHSDKRILHPMIRSGERGSGSFRQVTWDEALDYIEHSFKDIISKYGPNAIAGYSGGSAREDSHTYSKTNFFKALGSKSCFSAYSTCNFSSNIMTPLTTMGVPTARLRHDVKNSDIIFVWGKNPETDSGPRMYYNAIQNAKKCGAKVIVIDPRGEVLSELADWWIPVLPGSDGALAMAMLKLIIEEDRYDHYFVENFTRGFEEFRNYLSQKTLEEFSKNCGISVSDIRKLAELFCSTKKISLVSYTGLEYQLSGVQNNRAIQVLWAITGKLDVSGGLCFNAEHFPTTPILPFEQAKDYLGYNAFPLFVRMCAEPQMAAFPDAVLKGVPYPIRALIISAASPAVTYPDQPMWHEIYKKLDCLVVLERFMTEDAKYADVILPATSLFENQSVAMIPPAKTLTIMRNRIIPPQGEAMNDAFIYQRIAERLGFGDKLPKNDEELELALVSGDTQFLQQVKSSPYGVQKSMEPHYKKYESGLLRADGKPGFPTPSGKFEISSVYIEECGYTGYPEYKDIRELEGIDGKPGEYPFLLTTAARDSYRFSSFGANIPEIAKFTPQPMVDISPEDAKELGISDGDLLTIETVFGAKNYPARLTPMARKSIHVPYGGGSSYMPDAWKDGNINDICSWNHRDPLSGFLTFKSVPCKVYKAK